MGEFGPSKAFGEKSVVGRSSADGDPNRAINERVHRDLDLVAVVAKQILRIIGGAVQLDELMAAGREGLFDAARRYDPSHGIPFRAYANYRVKGAIVDMLRKTLRLPRRAYERLAMFQAASAVNQGECAAALHPENPWYEDQNPEQRLDDQLAAIVTAATLTAELAAASMVGQSSSSPVDPEAACERAELLALVRTAIGELDECEARALTLCCFEEKSHDEAAEVMRVSKSWAHRLHTRAIQRLTKRLTQAVGK